MASSDEHRHLNYLRRGSRPDTADMQREDTQEVTGAMTQN